LGIHPLSGKKDIESSYIDYLKTSFFINDHRLMRKFENAVDEEDRFAQGPYLEVTAPYQKSKSMLDLINDGILSPLFKNVNQEALPITRELYSHQVKAVEKAYHKENFIVATGTGSGKTESFMLPILNDLLKEQEQGTLSPGVRALFVYPMNALANDQMKRLRKILENTPEITFGRYTGETKNKRKDAEELFKQVNRDEKLLENELLSREEMRDNPPHILVTNYAMLEYLLLRPDDTPFFDGPFSNSWKFIVLDEAHTYNGAKGVEIGMLLRRLKDRVFKNIPFHGSLQCIATSATLGSGKDAKRKVIQFAENLFDEKFNYFDESNCDIIEAERITYSDYYEPRYQPEWSVYSYLLDLLSKEEISDKDLEGLSKYGVTLQDVEGIERTPPRFIYEFLKHDKNLFLLREILIEKPKKISVVSNQIFNHLAKEGRGIKQEILQEYIVKLVELAVKAKGTDIDEPLLPARYHVFIRSIEGAFVQFYPEIKFSLETKKFDEESNFPYFELGVCDSCGQPHLIGEERDGKLIQQQGLQSDDNIRFNAYMIVNGELSDEVYDEDEELLEGAHDSQDLLYELCPCCSAFNIKGENPSDCCEHGKKIKKLTLKKEVIVFDKHAKCGNCGKRGNNPIRQFITGQDGATSVLSTSLYQQLIKGGKREIAVNSTQSPKKDSGGFDFLTKTEVKKSTESIYDPQKLLIFSDSRQAAAYFSPYLERTYSHIIWRNIIYSVLGDYSDQELGVDSLTNKVIKKAEKYNLFDLSKDKLGKEKEAQQYIMRELVKGEERNSLEGVGLIDIRVELPQNILDNKEQLGGKFGLSGDEVIELFNVLFDSFRYYNALWHPSSSDPKDEVFFPKNRQVSINKSQSIAKKSIMSWLPSSNRINKRINYLSKVYEKKGITKEKSNQKAIDTLTDIWTYFIDNEQFLPGYFSVIKGNRVMMYSFWRLYQIDRALRCNTCGNVTTRNILNVCPKHNCNGELIEFNPSAEFNHYRKLYKNIIPVSMSVKEHTAQLSPETAMNYQEDFVKGKINVLSCSTTFEMGVDVGDLESVFMRNVPPETANYIQRAGRAGRRKSSVAFVLTFAQRRSHDLTYYERPEEMIAGIVKPPIFKMDNKKIIKRHLHSVALSQFFRENEDYFGEIQNFFRSEEGSGTGQYKLKTFLENKPSNLFDSVSKIVPKSLEKELELKTWGWTKDLLVDSGQESLLEKVTKMYFENIEKFKELATKNFEENTGRVDVFQKLIRTQLSESLISYFSRHNLLPKYGFPVDVVEMQIMDKESERIRLNRDLSMAISEYAPGSQIIANGFIFESVGLRFVKGFELKRKYYTECKKCKHYSVLKESDPFYEKSQMPCESCGEEVPINKIIVPDFGFVAKKKGYAGEKKPVREFRSRVFFSEYDFQQQDTSKEIEKETVYSNFTLKAKYSPFGKLAVVNSGKGKGYHLCETCGHVIRKGNQKKTNKHKAPNGSYCSGKYQSRPIHLGHEFMSDVLEIQLENLLVKHENEVWNWESLLYGILNGASVALGIDRNDIDGCIHYKNQTSPSIILYDKVPGGAGYMKEIYNQLEVTFEESLSILKNCSCGKETSCYGCLKNYSNQFAHDFLSRGAAIDILKSVCDSLNRPLASNTEDGSLGKFSDNNEIKSLIIKQKQLIPTEWQGIIELIDESCITLVQDLIKEGVPVPEVGYEIADYTGTIGEAELAWEDQKIAVLLQDNEKAINVLETKGWYVVTQPQLGGEHNRLMKRLMSKGVM